jgi:hypothetical protein
MKALFRVSGCVPLFFAVRTLEDADIEASKMIGALTTAEFDRLVQRQADGRVNRVYTGELPSRSNPSWAGDDKAGTSKKRKRAVAKGGHVQTRRSAKAAVESDGEEEDVEDADVGSEEDGSRGYTPALPLRNPGQAPMFHLHDHKKSSWRTPFWQSPAQS